MKIRSIIFDILVGVPGGCLIFAAMFMVDAILSRLLPLFHANSWTFLIILSITSFGVGLLARLMRPIHGLGTASAAGIIAALLILYLRNTSASGTDLTLVFGPTGMLAALIFSPLGAWMFPKFWKHPLITNTAPKITSK
jgi:hypothetical protein